MFTDRYEQARRQQARIITDALLEADVSCVIHGERYRGLEKGPAVFTLFVLERSRTFFDHMYKFEREANERKEWYPEPEDIINSLREMLHEDLLPKSNITFDVLAERFSENLSAEAFADYLSFYITGQLREISHLAHSGPKLRQFECNLADISAQAKKNSLYYEQKAIDSLQFVTDSGIPSEEKFLSHLNGRLGELLLPQSFISSFHSVYQSIEKIKEEYGYDFRSGIAQREIATEAYKVVLEDFDFEAHYEEYASWEILSRATEALCAAVGKALDELRDKQQISK